MILYADLIEKVASLGWFHKTVSSTPPLLLGKDLTIQLQTSSGNLCESLSKSHSPFGRKKSLTCLPISASSGAIMATFLRHNPALHQQSFQKLILCPSPRLHKVPLTTFSQTLQIPQPEIRIQISTCDFQNNFIPTTVFIPQDASP